MKCAQVKELLSEYIDGTLDVQKKAPVKGHLMSCKSCSEELASLRAYIKELGSLKAVKAPEDFLEKVHQRLGLERRFEFKRIIHKIFVPVRIKVPLELAGVMATAILVICILNVGQPPRQRTYGPSVSKPATITMAKKPAEESALKREETGLRVTAPPEKIKFREETGEGVFKKDELALESREKESAGSVDDYSAEVAGRLSGQEERPIELALLIKPELLVVNGKVLSEALFRVRELIEIVEGQVISVEYEKETQLPQYIITEVPAVHYTAFLEKLGRIGELQKPLPSGPEKLDRLDTVTGVLPSKEAEGKGQIQLRIKFICE